MLEELTMEPNNSVERVDCVLNVMEVKSIAVMISKTYQRRGGWGRWRGRNRRVMAVIEIESHVKNEAEEAEWGEL
jgi:hypothetical protein